MQTTQTKGVGALGAILLFAGGLFLGIFAGQGMKTQELAADVPIGDTAHAISDVDFTLFWDVWRKIQQDYVHGPVDDQALVYGALHGLVDGVGDPHSSFFSPEEAKEFASDIAGSFDGIGAQIGKKEGEIVVIAPLDDSPAARAGIQAGDRIWKIDDLVTDGISVEEAVHAIRGPRGTTVTLLITHLKQEQVEEIKIVRDKIEIKEVEWRMEGDAAVMEIHTFSEDVATEFRKAVREVLAKNPRGIVVDVRNNPGGLLDRAVSIAGEWTGPRTIVIERDRNGHVQEIPALNEARLHAIPTVVLVNAGSASASEILAGALQDYGLATILGEVTYGKGSVQVVEDLPDGSALKISIAEWLTPKRRSIEKNGITPDQVVPFTAQDIAAKKDTQLEAALKIIQEKK